jgi:hypothetical protein
LVVYLPLWKIWVRQLGWWTSHILWKNKQCSKPPTSIGIDGSFGIPSGNFRVIYGNSPFFVGKSWQIIKLTGPCSIVNFPLFNQRQNIFVYSSSQSIQVWHDFVS